MKFQWKFGGIDCTVISLCRGSLTSTAMIKAEPKALSNTIPDVPLYTAQVWFYRPSVY